MIRIRMRRMGSNKKPFFRIVVADIRRPNGGLCLEQLGWYDPKRRDKRFEVKLDRVDYWTRQGAQISDTVRAIVRKARKTAPIAIAAPAEGAVPVAQA